MAPTFGNGKICYLEIPARDSAVSSSFYRDVFGLTMRADGGGRFSFDDGVGEVSGTWVLDRPPVADGGIVISIMVEDAAATSVLIVEAGGEIVRAVDPDADVTTALFRDPGGNLLGIYQHGG